MYHTLSVRHKSYYPGDRDAVPQITTSDQTYVKIKGNDYDIGERATRTISRRRSARASG